MNLYNKDKDKDKFQSFVILTKKIHDNYFWTSFFIKRSYNVFLLTFMMFKQVKVGKHIEYMHQKSSKNMFIVKFHHGMKCLHTFFFFSSRDEISSQQKRVNIKRHFTIDRDDFISGRVPFWDEILCANTILQRFSKFLERNQANNQNQRLSIFSWKIL